MIYLLQSAVGSDYTVHTLGYVTAKEDAESFVRIYNINRHHDKAYFTEVELFEMVPGVTEFVQASPRTGNGKLAPMECQFVGTGRFCKHCGQHRDYHNLNEKPEYGADVLG